LQIPSEALGEKYLGLPPVSGRGNNHVFNYISGRIMGFVGGWAEKTLSCAAREILVKANAQSVPTYAMSCFKLPKNLCKKITTYVSNYWWGSSVDNHKLHWQMWEQLTRAKEDGGMGFRDFSLFNDAMLGKQGWRLLTRPASLCARVLKGKYYPHSDFLRARKAKRCSNTWRSILQGRQVIQKGIIHRIGPGNINLWQENWIPGVQQLKPLVRKEGVQAELVRDLFIPGTRVWDVPKVKDVLLGFEAEEVLNIYTSMSLEEDILAWAHERHGNYSVRSAYRVLKKEQAANEMAAKSEVSGSLQSTIWKKVWKLNVPPKVRNFWWRVIHNFLPSKSELKRRHIEKESHCEVCGNSDETVFHVALECPVAKMFWAEAKIVWGFSVPRLHPVTWMVDMINHKEAARLVCGVWSLWTGRNARRHGRKVWKPGEAVRYVARLVDEMATLKVNKTVAPKPQAHRNRPEVDWVKVNSDAAFDAGSGTGGSGVVIRGHQGQLIAAGARWLDHVADPLSAETIAMKEALELTVEVGADQVIMETDCAVLKTLLDTENYRRSPVSSLCHDILELSRGFSKFKLVWTQRQANGAAHWCASTVSDSERSMYWFDEFPCRLREISSNDCNPAD
jgi:ribonuclease HI